jgi:hypothetical protein
MGSCEQTLIQLLQFRVLRLGLLQDGDIGVGVFPERQKILVSSTSFCSFARQSIGATELQMCQREQRIAYASNRNHPLKFSWNSNPSRAFA